MALPESSVSSACRSVAEFLRQRFQADGMEVQVLIGSPVDAEPESGDAEHRVNLFFHRFEPGGFGTSPGPGEPWWLRVHLMVTAFAVLEDQVSAGENDLRLLGEVMRYFHEVPVMAPVTVAGETVRTQVVFQPLSLEDINRLWSTLKDVAYRPSLAYELALVPVVPEERSIPAPRVGAVGHQVRATLDRGEAVRREPRPPPVPATTVDFTRVEWAPRVCFVVGGTCAESLSFEVGSPELTAFQPQVLIAGKPGTQVELRWQVWDAQEGWREAGAPVNAPVPVSAIAPDAPGGPTVALSLPFKDHAGQALLYAQRTFTRPSDGAVLTARSNPLLVSLHGGGP